MYTDFDGPDDRYYELPGEWLSEPFYNHMLSQIRQRARRMITQGAFQNPYKRADYRAIWDDVYQKAQAEGQVD